MAHKLRIQNDVYEIEVNDKGETIQFDVEDIELPFKFQSAYEGIKEIQKNLKAKLLIIDKQQDRKSKGDIFSKKEKATLEAQREAFRQMRVEMDKFLGEGGCQKIFGDKNSLDMYDKLWEALSEKGEDGLSHLDRLKLSTENTYKKLQKKYDEKYANNPEVI